MYGSSESVAGDLIAELKLRERLFVATKVWTSGRAEGVRQMEQSFQRLRVERMDLMQIHNLVDAGTHTKTLLEMKEQEDDPLISASLTTPRPDTRTWSAG